MGVPVLPVRGHAHDGAVLTYSSGAASRARLATIR